MLALATLGHLHLYCQRLALGGWGHGSALVWDIGTGSCWVAVRYTRWGMSWALRKP